MFKEVHQTADYRARSQCDTIFLEEIQLYEKQSTLRLWSKRNSAIKKGVRLQFRNIWMAQL